MSQTVEVKPPPARDERIARRSPVARLLTRPEVGALLGAIVIYIVFFVGNFFMWYVSPWLALALSVVLALLFTWLGLAVAYFTIYPAGFFITTFAFGLGFMQQVVLSEDPKVLDGMIDGRFYWAPFLEKLSRCVALNAQLTSIDGTALEDGKISVVIEGLAAGREPRAAAEELRQLLLEQLGQSYQQVKVEFKSLEDLDTIVNIGGSNQAMARFSLNATFSTVEAKATPTPGPRTKIREPRS